MRRGGRLASTVVSPPQETVSGLTSNLDQVQTNPPRSGDMIHVHSFSVLLMTAVSKSDSVKILLM